MRVRRETVEHPFGTMKARMGGDALSDEDTSAGAGQDAGEIDRGGLRLKLRRQQAEKGDIVLLYADESEALTHPYLSRVWAKRGSDLRVPAPGRQKRLPQWARSPGKAAS